MEYINSDKTGIVLGYFQTPALHVGHKFILDWVNARCETLCVLLRSKIAVPTDINPLSFEARKQMILDEYPKAQVLEVIDCYSDKIWSRHVDDVIQKQYGTKAILYWAKDQYAPNYSGSYEFFVLDKVESPTVSDLRNECTVQHSMSYRIGVIHAVNERYPIVYSAVDCAPYKKENGIWYVLLGHQEGDDGKYRFIGGIVDKIDTCYEDSSNRELTEEAGDELRHGKPEYIMSMQINDYRYENTKDGVMTTFFGMKYISGTPTAKDDIDSVQWFPVNDIMDNIVPIHQTLAKNFIAFIKTKEQSKFKKIINLTKQIFHTIIS